MSNEKGIFCRDALNLERELTNRLTMTNHKPNQNNFQYECSFCLRELPSGGHRFDGIGACPLHFAIATKLIDGLRRHAANYFNLEVKK